MTYIKPSNLIDSTVLQAVAATAGDLTFAKGQVSLTGLGTPIKLSDIVSYKKTSYSAGVLQIMRLDFAGCTSVAGNVYNLQLRRKDTNQVVTYSVIATDNLTTTLAGLFLTQVKNDLSAIVTCGTQTSSYFIVTEKDLATGGFSAVLPTGGATTTSPTAHVDASGILAEAQAYLSTVSAGNYSKYDFTVNKEIRNSFNNKEKAEVLIRVYLNELDGDFGALDAALVAVLDGTSIDSTSGATIKATVDPYIAVI